MWHNDIIEISKTRNGKMAVLKFTDQHEWLSCDSNMARVGITDYAQAQLGDVVFVELPEIGSTFKKGDDAACC